MALNSVQWEELERDIIALDVRIFPFEDCEIEKQVGVGAAMTVSEGTCLIGEERRRVAFKEHRRLNGAKVKKNDVKAALADLRHEIKLMQRLRYHPNIVQTLGVTFRQQRPILVVELGNDTLDSYLHERDEAGKTATWFEKTLLCLDVLRGVQGLHEAEVVHGDLKGDNVLVFVKPGRLEAKISDFGYSSTLSSIHGAVGGTPPFMAPEATGKYPELQMFMKKPTQDIYSFGLVTFQIASNGAMPNDDDDDELSREKAVEPSIDALLAHLPDDTPPEFHSVIFSTTKRYPPDRISVDRVFEIFHGLLGKLRGADSSISPPDVDVDLATSAAAMNLGLEMPPPTLRTILGIERYKQAKKALEDYADEKEIDLKAKLSVHALGQDHPLFWSAREGHADVVFLLGREYGVKADVKMRSGSAALHIAAEKGHGEVARVLVKELGGSIDIRDGYGASALHQTIQPSHETVAVGLVKDLGADVNALDKLRLTPLAYAAQSHRLQMAKLLIETLGADPNLKDSFELSPLTHAEKSGNTEMVALLRSLGAV